MTWELQTQTDDKKWWPILLTVGATSFPIRYQDKTDAEAMLARLPLEPKVPRKRKRVQRV